MKKQKGFVGWVVLVLFVVFLFFGSIAALGAAQYARTQVLGLTPGYKPSEENDEEEGIGSGTINATQSELDKVFGFARLTNGCSPIESQLTGVNFMGKNVQVHQKARAAFEKVNSEIQQSGIQYNFWKDSGGGTYNCRTNVNNRSAMSTHAYGIAIDINPSSNPNYRRRGTACRHDIPDNVIQIFKNNGFVWGGNFRSVCDAMHFQWMGWK